MSGPVRIRGRRPPHSRIRAALEHAQALLPDVPEPAVNPPAPSRSKYGNVATVVDGIRFMSKREAKRYGELRLLAETGVITGLVLQPRYPLIVGDKLVCTYVGDFAYVDHDGTPVTEDVKGHLTDVFRLKARLFAALKGYEIRLTR
jgi:hypothetical protein